MSIIASIITFAYLGYFSRLNDVAIEDLPGQGMELVFITYPAALSTMKNTKWLVLIFFAMLSCIGMNSVYNIIEHIEVILIDMRLYYKEQQISEKCAKLVVCAVMMVPGALFSTRPGFYILSFINSFVLFIPLVFISFVNYYIFRNLIRCKWIHRCYTETAILVHK